MAGAQLCPGSAMAKRIFLMKNNILGSVVQCWVHLVHCVHGVPAYCPKEKQHGLLSTVNMVKNFLLFYLTFVYFRELRVLLY